MLREVREPGGSPGDHRRPWTGEQIDAQPTLPWGVVSEVVTHDRALNPGIQLARGWPASPALHPTLRKQTLDLKLRRRITQVVPGRDGARSSDGGRPGYGNQT